MGAPHIVPVILEWDGHRFTHICAGSEVNHAGHGILKENLVKQRAITDIALDERTPLYVVAESSGKVVDNDRLEPGGR